MASQQGKSIPAMLASMDRDAKTIIQGLGKMLAMMEHAMEFKLNELKAERAHLSELLASDGGAE